MSLFYKRNKYIKKSKGKVGDIMTSLKTIRVNRRVGSLFAVAALVLATVTPGLVPAFASAAQLTERSVQLSSSSKEATNVSYEVTFTPAAAAGAVVFDFCENSPLIGSACTPPVGFDASTAATPTSGFVVSQLTTPADNTIKAVGTITAAPTTITLTGITNPDEAGSLYVRMVTFSSDTAADSYLSATPGAHIDDGSAALSITDTVGVSAAVLETMTFCVSGGTQVIADNCTGATSAALELGEASGSVKALDATKRSEADLYSQISTNAASGAVVSLKSNAENCGGLLLNGAAIDEEDEATKCYIKPATGTGEGLLETTGGKALFGLTVAPQTAANGTLAAASTGAYYSDSVFKLNFVSGNTAGVTSTYGDPVLDTAGAPANNANAKITFGASIANNTPAGLYSADFSLIATGKF
jgi:hypothetical protein